MMTRSQSSNLAARRLTLMILTFVMSVALLACSSLPRKHWWQFWRPKATNSSVFNPDTTVLPPGPETLDGRGGTPLEVPPGPGGDQAEPNALRGKTATARSELRTVYFDYDSAELTGQGQQTLDGNADWLLAHPNLQIQIEGHCDERGTSEYNLNLGDRRAKSAKAYLVSKGVTADNLHTISYGEERPIDPGHSESAWAKNRRVQFLVY